MLEIFLIYKWTALFGSIAAVALALVGSQLAARNEAVQSLVVSQSASFGVFFGLLIQQTVLHDLHLGTVIPILFGFLISLFVYWLCECVIAKKWIAKNTHYLALFSLLMALTYLIISLAPNVESHMLAAFFGDLALISNTDSYSIGIISILVIAFVWRFWNSLSAMSFEKVTFDVLVLNSSQKKLQMSFIFVYLFLITVSVQMMGLLFTLSCLFFPVIILSQPSLRFKSLKLALAVCSSLGCLLGLLFSFWHGNLPTVPCVSVGLVLISSLLSIIFLQQGHKKISSFKGLKYEEKIIK